MQTVVETPFYLRKAETLFSDDERAGIVAMISADPDCGDLIQGTGGFRKGSGRPWRNGKAGRRARRVYPA